MGMIDPTIDPITGLPVLNPSDVIQQIPLGVQTFPYEDLQATARPTRGPIYGDDILPVSSLTAGQHPSTGSAQTVQTDGNHRLLVSGDGGSGGGSGPITLGKYLQQEDLTAATTTELFPLSFLDRYLQWIDLSVDFTWATTGLNHLGMVMMMIRSTAGEGIQWLFVQGVRVHAAAPFVVPGYVQTHFQPTRPIDLTASCPAADGPWSIMLTVPAQIDTCYYAALAVTSATP